MKKIIPFIIFLISACGSTAPNFLPGGNNLPDGIVGQDYLTEIEITNVILFKENVGVNISPPNSGLKWNPKVTKLKRGGAERVDEDYHYIRISGKPKEVGEVLVHINGYSMGTTAPGSKIDKMYVIKVKAVKN
ncbi:TPA: hypothetical protein ACXE54_005981 [Klebsiella michiganensis]|uniref:hypothetical protein n=1 Tax=Klebsiella michiganensis TaxID=1134687 RepID=UPI000C99DAC0|nr:hypothetical protein [Klebsiella michiganensis]EKP1134210.1 hypothetical protein [Klebsiella michiganensis]EKV4189510.1 hypothetical protein [Klebsiella michiganensis]KAB7488058.1 hypothetical protein F7Q97_28750 [Klebsiella michiganensis]MBG2647316.1 hypothetical protein [Klebsiella michiganensis]MBG2669221.1 hypothetical protein [Klebsiella michiganensis]